jgi:protein ImuA
MGANAFMAGGGFAPLPERHQSTADGRRIALAAALRALPASLPPHLKGEGRIARNDTGKGQNNVPFALPRLDAMLAGGLRRDALHEIRSGESRDAGAATGFAVAVVAHLITRSKPVLWIVETASADEAGFPYAAGISRFGLSPAHLIVVRVKKAADVLWVFEEGLRCRGLSAVLAEIRGNPRQLDLTASRRLLLRASEHGVTGLLLRQAAEVEPSAAVTRWVVAPRPAATTDDYPAGIGNPAWRLTLERNRFGATGAFDLEWDHERATFVASAGPAHSFPLAAPAPDRPPPPAEAGAIVALRRAS